MPKALPVLDTTDAGLLRHPGRRTGRPRTTRWRSPLRLKALADPVRVRLMSLHARRGRRRASAPATSRPPVGVTEATVSHHLKQLRDAGLVEGTRRGHQRLLPPRTDALGALCRVIDPTCC